MANESTNLPSAARDGEVVDADMHQLQQLIELERERIEAANRRTEVTRLAIEASDKADQRQYDFHLANLKVEEQDKIRRHNLSRIIVLGFGVFGIAFFSLMLYMLFFGTESQSTLAAVILSTALTGFAGWGIVSGILAALRRLTQR